MSEGFVIEIRRGTGEPRFLRLDPGADVQPMSIGARGDWRVDADGMLDVHAFVYFDGAALYVQSADPRTPARVNGRAVTGEWTAVEAPCTLALGDARLVYCPASQASAVSAPLSARSAAGAPMRHAPEPARAPARAPAQWDDSAPTMAEMSADHLSPADEDATHSIPLPGGKPLPTATRPHGNGGGFEVDDDMPTRMSAPRVDFPIGAPNRAAMQEDEHETTRALPLPDVARAFGAAPAPPAPPRPPSPAALGTSPMPMMAPSEGASQGLGAGPIAAPPQGAPKTEKPSPLTQLKQQWKEATLPKKAIVVLLPIAFVMVIFGLDDEPQPAAHKKPRPAASASVVASAKPEASSDKSDTKADKVEPKNDVVAEAPKPTQSAAPHVAQPAAPTKGGKESSTTATKTPERLAVDAVAAGSWEPAAKLYDDLAQAHPENPAYKQAARLLRAKASPKK